MQIFAHICQSSGLYNCLLQNLCCKLKLALGFRLYLLNKLGTFSTHKGWCHGLKAMTKSYNFARTI